jgi:hypothetical protein
MKLKIIPPKTLMACARKGLAKGKGANATRAA